MLASLVLALPAFASNSAPPPPPPAPKAEEKPADAASIQGEVQLVPADGAGAKEGQAVPAGGGIELQAGQPVEDPAAKDVTYLGVETTKLRGFATKHLNLPADTGVVVDSLDKDGPAAKAGIAKDDIITKVDGKAVASHKDLIDQVQAKKPGEQVKIEFVHEGKPAKATATLGAHKPEPPEVEEAEVHIGGLENFPPEQQKQLREQMDKMREEAFKEHGIDGIPGLHELEKSSTTMKMMDQQGSIELKNRDGGKEARVCDKSGKEVWSGPWDTEQDKAAAPPEIRERLETLGSVTRVIPGAGGIPVPAPAPAPAPKDVEPTPASGKDKDKADK